MAEIVEKISDAKKNGTINVYAIRYSQRGQNDNVAIALPGNMDSVLRERFCFSVENYQNSTEVPWNPLIDGFEAGTYESVSLKNVDNRWNEIECLLDHALDYQGKENREKVPLSNLYVCVLTWNNQVYYLCSKLKGNSERILKGKVVLTSHQDELKVTLPKDSFIMSTNVSFIIDMVENKVIVLDKKSFQEVFHYDDYQQEKVRKGINRIDSWCFLESPQEIKAKINQKNVYLSLAKIFDDLEYLDQIESVKPSFLKKSLLTNCPNYFSENDFSNDRLVISSKNLDNVMKMLSKGFKFNFFTNNAETL